MTVRTRFAPSPTGYMHLGGMRTALFNWLFARRHGGRFILRIDDTDQARNQDAALGPILQAFRWLGLDWDEGPEVGGDYGPYYQSQRGDLYRAAAAKLEAAGLAYRDYSTKEETDADRKAADKTKTPYINIRRSLDLTDSQRADLEAQGRPWALRFLIPRGQKLVLQDLIRGQVEWDTSLLPDPVIQRVDGSPLYNFATVVDDAQLAISHVIRAEEHLSNTPIQMLLNEALGYQQPQFAHVPYVAAPGSKEKLSKRKVLEYRKNPQFKRLFERGDEVFPQIGLDKDDVAISPVMVAYYELIGYLPAGVLNALARLGWSLDDSTEIFSLDTLKQNFSLERVVKAPAGFDTDKLFLFQGHWMKELPLEEKVEGCLGYLTRAGLVAEPVSVEVRAKVAALVESLGERLKLFSDVLEARWLFTDEYPVDAKMFDKRVKKAGIPAHLQAFLPALKTLEPFDVPTLEAALHAFATESGETVGNLIHALRLATTGQSVGPGVYDCLVLLGRDTSVARIERSVSLATEG